MASNSSALPRVTFQTPEKPGEESSHRKLGKLTIKYNRKDLQRWLDLEEWINAQLQELYQCRVSSWGKSAACLSGKCIYRSCVYTEVCLLCLIGNSFLVFNFQQVSPWPLCSTLVHQQAGKLALMQSNWL